MAPNPHPSAPRNTIETYSTRPEREPPRNEKGEIVCQHPSCQGKNEIFRRPCEWNKHMDKHERPYKCNEATCEQNPGFTYSGGLLRHMREVHKRGVGPARKPLYCPHANCVRSSGEGFTRRENLEEHLRRRHSASGRLSPSVSAGSPTVSNEDSTEHQRKRRRTEEPEQADGSVTSKDEDLSDDLMDLSLEEVRKQLSQARRQIIRQAETIKDQKEQVARLRSQVAALPSGMIYDTKPSAAPRTNGVGGHEIEKDSSTRPNTTDE